MLLALWFAWGANWVVTKLGLAPDKFAGGHGTVANYADLTAVAGKVN